MYRLDSVYVNKIQEVAERLFLESPPIRITKKAIKQKIEYIGFFRTYRCQLPMSDRALNEIVEDTESYYLRRIDYFVKECQERNEDISVGKILRNVRIQNITPKVEKALRNFC